MLNKKRLDGRNTKPVLTVYLGVHHAVYGIKILAKSILDVNCLSSNPISPKTTIRTPSVHSHCLSSVALSLTLEPCPLPSSKRALWLIGFSLSERPYSKEERSEPGR